MSSNLLNYFSYESFQEENYKIKTDLNQKFEKLKTDSDVQLNNSFETIQSLRSENLILVNKIKTLSSELNAFQSQLNEEQKKYKSLQENLMFEKR